MKLQTKSGKRTHLGTGITQLKLVGDEYEFPACNQHANEWFREHPDLPVDCRKCLKRIRKGQEDVQQGHII